MWKSAVEKPVEIVEKYGFSTATLGFSNSAPGENSCISACIFRAAGENQTIMSPGNPRRYLQKKGGKVGKLPKQRRPHPAETDWPGQIFVKILQRCQRYDFPHPGNTEEGTDFIGKRSAAGNGFRDSLKNLSSNCNFRFSKMLDCCRRGGL